MTEFEIGYENFAVLCKLSVFQFAKIGNKYTKKTDQTGTMIERKRFSNDKSKIIFSKVTMMP